MARPLRIEYKGALYHVFSRGNERRKIFFDTQDKQLFLRTLGQMCKRFNAEIYAFMLMDNHYHLLLKTLQANLSRAMQWLAGSYVCRFNRKHGRSGHLFQGRFRMILVENTAYLLRLSCYIHRNPLRANLVKRLISYRWSSYRYYAYGSRKPPEWLKVRPILSRIRAADKHKGYRAIIQAYADEEKSIWEDIKHGLILGSKRFIERVRSNYLIGEPHEEVPQQKMLSRGTNIQDVAMSAAKVLNRELDDFLIYARIPHNLKTDRDVIIYFLWSTGWYTNKEIGELFNLSYSSISHRVKIFQSDAIQKSNNYRQLQLLKSLIKM
jgi:putative transposase